MVQIGKYNPKIFTIGFLIIEKYKKKIAYMLLNINMEHNPDFLQLHNAVNALPLAT